MLCNSVFNGTGSRRGKALGSAGVADGLMKTCRLCGWDCGIDRTSGPAGRCHAEARARVFQQRMEWAGETRFVPTRLVNFSGCNFRCSFCLTGRDSQNAARGEPFDPKAFARRLAADFDQVRSVTIEGGEASLFLPDALRCVAEIPDSLPVVWKTNAWSSTRALDLLKGCVDVILADFKFGNNRCAERLAGVPDYLPHVRRNLQWAEQNSTLVVRHLLMPGHFECCFVPVVEWLSQQMPRVPLSLVTGFTPLWNSRRHPELMTPPCRDEHRRARDLALQFGLTLEEWTITRPLPGKPLSSEPPDNHIYIDPSGTVRIPFMTAELGRCLEQLQHEIPVAVNFP